MTQPPFRADHVGSFLRPERLRKAREKFFAKTLPATNCARSRTGASARS